VKKYFSIIALFFMAGTTFAIFINNFTTWNDLIERSSDIVIAKYTPAPANGNMKKTVAITDGVLYSDIDVLLVLKGNKKPGLSNMASQYCPSNGEQFLLFANYKNDQFYSGYTAIEDYRIVPINASFQTNQLSDKSLDEQIQLILNSRIKDLNDEIERDNDEKKRLEMDAPTSVPEPSVLALSALGGACLVWRRWRK
jgi:hypothetical protein